MELGCRKYGLMYGLMVGHLWDISEQVVERMQTYGAVMVNDWWCCRKNFLFSVAFV